MKKKIVLLSLLMAFTILLSSCEMIDDVIFDSRRPEYYLTADHSTNMNSDIYYLSDGDILKCGQSTDATFVENGNFCTVFANTSNVFAADSEKVYVFDTLGENVKTFDISNVERMYGDDEFVFFYYYHRRGGASIDYSCDVYDIAKDEVLEVNKLADELAMTDNLYEIGSQYALTLDIGDWTVLCITPYGYHYNERLYEVYLYNRTTKERSCSALLQEDIMILDVYDDTVTYLSTGAVYAIDKDGNYERLSSEFAEYALPMSDDISKGRIIVSVNSGIAETASRTTAKYHEEDYLLQYNCETREYDEIFKTESGTQLIGSYGDVLVLCDLENGEIYSCDFSLNDKAVLYNLDDYSDIICFEMIENVVLIYTKAKGDNTTTELLFKTEV